MGQSADTLLSHMRDRTGYDLSFEEVRDLQVAAMNERFQEQVGRIKLLAMRAQDAGLDPIASMADAYVRGFS